MATDGDRYRLLEDETYRQIEREVVGADYGADGYTTQAQVDEMADQLRLGPDDLLLDVGTGRGWPALKLAATTGCSVVGTDLPVDGLAIARRRAVGEGLEDRVAFIGAGALDLPFPRGSFDAIVHTDVLC